MINQIDINERFSIFINQNCRLNDKATDLFQLHSFHALHQKKFLNYYHFQWVDRHRKESYGELHLFEKADGVFSSPGFGSYGSFFFNSTLSISERELFSNSVLELIRAELKPRRFTVALPPDAYHPENNSYQMNFFHRASFIPYRVELNFSIDVDTQAFDQKIDRGNRKKLTRAIEDQLRCEVSTGEDWKEGFHIISENREKKGYPLTMTEEGMAEMFQTFPSQVMGWKVTHQGRSLAGGITMNVNPNILYVFMWGEAIGAEQLSPVTFLAKNIYEYCQQKKMRIMDLGTSTLDSIPNHGLINYKMNLGAKVCPKYYLERKYE